MKQKKTILAKAFFAFIVFFSVFTPVTEVKAATLFSYSNNPGTSRKALYTFDKAYTNVVITYKGSYSGQVTPYTQVWAEVSCNGQTGTSNWPASEKTLNIGNVSSGTVVYGEASASDVGLNMTITGDVAHTHSWSTAWSYDANYHWHKCTGCSEITGKAAHSYTITDGAKTYAAPTITWSGATPSATQSWTRTVTKKCSCGATAALTSAEASAHPTSGSDNVTSLITGKTNSITTWPYYGTNGTRKYNAAVTANGKTATAILSNNVAISAFSQPSNISDLNATFNTAKAATFSVSPTVSGEVTEVSTTYQWQVLKNGTWTNLTNGNGWSGVTTKTVSFTPTTYDPSITKIRCVSTSTVRDAKNTSTTKQLTAKTSSEAGIWAGTAKQSFAPTISSTLTTLNGVEGKPIVYPITWVHKVNGDHLEWFYNFKNASGTLTGTGTKIVPGDNIYSVRDSSTGVWRLATSTDIAAINAGTAPYSERNGTLAVSTFDIEGDDSNSGVIKLIINNPSLALKDMAIRVKAISGTDASDASLNPELGWANLAVLKSDFVDFSCTIFNEYQNINSPIDPYDVRQFSIYVEYSNGTHKLLQGDRRVRFLNDPTKTSLEDVRNAVCHVVSASDVQASGSHDMVTPNEYGIVTGVLKSDTNTIVYGNDTDANGTIDQWAYCSYGSVDPFGTQDQPSLNVTQGTYDDTYSSESPSRFANKVLEGEHTLFVIIPDFINPTRSIVTDVIVTGIDTEGPTLSPISAEWVSLLDSEGHPTPYKDGDLKAANFPLRLSVKDIKDNVTAVENITFEWYHNGELMSFVDDDGQPVATGNTLTLDGKTDSCNGVYKLRAIDEAGKFTDSDEINLSNVWDCTAPTVALIAEPEGNEPTTYRTITIDVEDTDENPANLADRPYAFVGPIVPDTADAEHPLKFASTGEPFDPDRLLNCYNNNDEDAINDPIWSIANSYTASENGLYYVYVRDKVGNVTMVGPGDGDNDPLNIANIDRQAPVINGVNAEPSVDENGNPNTYTNENGETDQYIRIVIDAKDLDENGQAKDGELLYKLEKDGEVIQDWTPNNVFDNLTEGGTYVVYVKDSAGNISRYVINNVDKNTVLGRIPDSEYAQIFGIYIKCSNNKYWTNEDVVITLEGGNANILAANNPFSYDGGNTWTNAREYVMHENGKFTLSVKDIYGHVYNYYELPITIIDKTAPTFTATPSGRNNTIVVNASDDPDQSSGSGLDELYYYFNGSSQKRTVTVFNEDTHTSGAQTIMVENLGTYDIWVRDKAGNTYHKEITITSVMSDNPLFVDDNGNPLSEEEIANRITSMITVAPTTWTNTNVTLTFNPSSTSGFARNPYSWDGGTNWLSSQSYTVSENGDYTLLIKDIYGNIYHSNIISVNNIDKVAPTIQAEQQGNNLIIASTDAQSGVAKIEWMGGTITSPTTLKTYTGNQSSISVVAELPSNGSYTVYAYDEAGNKNSISKTAFNVTTGLNNNNSNNNNSNTGNTSNTSANTGGNTIEKYYYNTDVEKTTPVYVEKYVQGSNNSGYSSNGYSGGGSGYSGGGGSYSQPTQTTPLQTTAINPYSSAIKTPTPTPTATPTPVPTKTGTGTSTTTTSSKVTSANSSPATSGKKVTSKVVTASATKPDTKEDVEVLDSENAKYRNSRVAGAVNATNDAGSKKGINIVLGIVGSLIALSGIAAGVYWYTTKYKPALTDGELSRDDYAFAEDIAMAQEDGTTEDT